MKLKWVFVLFMPTSCVCTDVELSLRITDLEGTRLERVCQGEPFLIESVVHNDFQDLGEPVITHLDKLVLVQKYPVSTHISIINGVQRMQRRYVYKARCDVLGQYALGPAYFDKGVQIIRSSALTFEVIKGAVTPGTATSDPWVWVKVHKNTVFVGEQLLLTVRLCFKKPVISLALEPLNLTQAVGMQLGPVRQETVEYDGKTWSCLTYVFAIYPQQPGELVIPSLQAYGERDKDAQSGFMAHFFFNFDREKVQARSKPCVITVHALPTAFQKVTMVGEFSRFTAALDKTSLEPGTAATLTLTLVGTGNPQLPLLNNLILPSALRQYESKKTLDLDVQHPGMLVRTQEIILQPLESGVVTIPAQTCTFFDPTTHTVKHLKTMPLQLVVKKGAVQKELTEQQEITKKTRSWPVIPEWVLIITSLLVVILIFGIYLKRLYAPLIDKLMAYHAFKKQVRAAGRTRDARRMYEAWFTLLERRLGVDHVPQSLHEISRFLAPDMHERFYAYVHKLEFLAFKHHEECSILDDIIAQTEVWVRALEEVL